MVPKPDVTPSWITAFLDFAPEAFDDDGAFWRAVVGSEYCLTDRQPRA